MSFKKKYNEYQQQIVPDEEFLEQLAAKMEQQKKKQLRKKKLRTIFISAVSTGTVIAAALIVIVSIPKVNVNNPVTIMGNIDKIFYQEGIFNNSEIFTDEKTVPEQLCNILLNSASVLYENSENKFEYDDKLSREFCESLALKIKNAEKTDEKFGENIKYYMLVTENGDVVKFRISGNILQVKEINYKIVQPF